MKKTLWIAAISFFLGVFLASYIFVYLPEKDSPDNFLEEPSSSLSSTLYATPTPQVSKNIDFTTIAEKIGPTVVRISAEKVEKRRSLGFESDPFEDFWDRFFHNPRQREQEFRSTAYGAGFFISSDGYILTNNHIVEKAIKVTVSSLQGKEYSAKVIGADPKTDLALLKIEDDSLPYANLGDSDNLKVGEWVLAIGNPLGLAHTMTAGIVSAKGRQLSGMMIDLPYQDFIQTDAAINRGNSGGPLVNLNEEVIGITSLIYSPSGGNIGIGFAIPSSLARKIVKQLKEKGKVVRGYLGVWMRDDITEDLQKLLNLKSKKGALINSVEPDTPADKAGLKRYDVIIEINGQSVEDRNDLLFKIADIPPGTKIELKIIRDGKEIIVPAKIAESEPEEAEEPTKSSENDIGYSVSDLTSSMARRYGFSTREGVVISKVTRYSDAEKKRLEAGDLILEINRKEITSVKEFRSEMKKIKPGDPYILLISREINRREPQEFIVTLRKPE